MPRSSRPALLVIDDDAQVLSAIRRDLSRVYGDRYRVIASDSPKDGLHTLETLQERAEQPALVMVDQRMPEMTGIEFLAELLTLFPQARRVLMTAYADTQVAVAAINQVQLHHYLAKPWEPPEELLYPVLDRLLADWEAERQAGPKAGHEG